MTYEQQTDTQIAEAYRALVAREARVDATARSLFYKTPGAWQRHLTRTRSEWCVEGTNERLTGPAAREAVAQLVADNEGEFSVAVPGKGWVGIREAREAVEKYDEAVAARDAAVRTYHELNDLYTGWSRFFLVTSSKGHIHSSMSCSTCRPTTSYGWLPELSGRTEADCVAEFGAALCTVCYPSAPVEWVGGFISKADAERRAA